MSEYTATPWQIKRGQVVSSKTGDSILVTNFGLSCGNYKPSRDLAIANTQHIVNCVNAYDELLEKANQHKELSEACERLTRKAELLDEALTQLEAMFNIARGCEVQLKATDFSLCGLTEDEAEKMYRHDAFCEIWGCLQNINKQVIKAKDATHSTNVANPQEGE